MTELLLVVTVAGRKLALRGAEVQSVIEVGALTPVPRAPAHVAGLWALRSRVLTAIDCSRCLGEVAAEPAGHAAVVDHEGHSYALLVEAVDDVTDALSAIEPTSAPLGEGWAAMTQGMVETAQGLLLVIDVAAMIAGPGDARIAA